MRTMARKTAFLQHFLSSESRFIRFSIHNAILISSNTNMMFRIYVTHHWWAWILIWLGLILLVLLAFPKLFCHYHESTNHDGDGNQTRIKEEKIKRLHGQLQQRILEKISPYTKVRSTKNFYSHLK